MNLSNVNFQGKLDGVKNLLSKGNIKANPVGEIMPKKIAYCDHSLLMGNKADLKLHLNKLEKYLSTHPDNIELRAQIAGLRQLLKTP